MSVGTGFRMERTVHQALRSRLHCSCCHGNFRARIRLISLQTRQQILRCLQFATVPANDCEATRFIGVTGCSASTQQQCMKTAAIEVQLAYAPVTFEDADFRGPDGSPMLTDCGVMLSHRLGTAEPCWLGRRCGAPANWRCRNPGTSASFRSEVRDSNRADSVRISAVDIGSFGI